MGLDIQSKEIIDKISEDLKVQPAMRIPRELMDKIQLVYGVNPVRKVSMETGAIADSAAATTILTTSSVKRTFFVGASLAVAKDIVATSTSTAIALQPLGIAAKEFITLAYEPVTAGDFFETVMLPIPMELEKGTVITIQHGTAVASIDGKATIFFYEVDPQ